MCNNYSCVLNSPHHPVTFAPSFTVICPMAASILTAYFLSSPTRGGRTVGSGGTADSAAAASGSGRGCTLRPLCSSQASPTYGQPCKRMDGPQRVSSVQRVCTCSIPGDHAPSPDTSPAPTAMYRSRHRAAQCPRVWGRASERPTTLCLKVPTVTHLVASLVGVGRLL